MAFSNQTSVSDGTLQTIILSIAFFDKSEIHVYRNGVEIFTPADYVWATSNSIQFALPQTVGTVIQLRRVTDISEMRHIFTEGAQFTNQTLDEDYTQILHIAQESREGGTLSELFNDLDMHQFRVRNMAPGVLPGDAINLEQYVSDTASVGNAAALLAPHLGSFAEAPLVRRDGSPLQKGDEYFNTVTNALYVWNGTSWMLQNANTAQIFGDLASLDISKGASLVGRAIRTINSVAELRATPGRYNGDVAYLVAYFDGWAAYAKPRIEAAGPVIWNASSTTDDDHGVTFKVADVVTGRWQRPVDAQVHSVWYGVVANDLSVGYQLEVQRATTSGCTNYGGVRHPMGQIRIDGGVSFPNFGFDIDGISGTGTEFVTDTAGIAMFDFSLCNGPAKRMVGIGFSKMTPGTYGNITAVKTFNTNGLQLTNCWGRGLLYGLEYHGSFINQTNCAWEYCYKGIRCLTGCIETAWVGTTFYKCEQADIELTGNNSTLSVSNSNHIGTRIDGILLTDCTNARFDQTSFANDGGTFTPNLIRLQGVTSGNTFDQVSSYNFGKIGVSCIGADVKRNRFTNLNLRGVAATGNRGIQCQSSSGNYFSGNIEGFEAGVEFNTAADTFVGKINGCSVGVLLNTANYCTLDVVLESNTVDVSNTNTTVLYLDRFLGNRAGLNLIPYLITKSGWGGVVEVGAMPTGLSWNSGMLADNTRNPVVGQPKGWRRITTGSGNVLGTDWVSIGNL